MGIQGPLGLIHMKPESSTRLSAPYGREKVLLDCIVKYLRYRFVSFLSGSISANAQGNNKAEPDRIRKNLSEL